MAFTYYLPGENNSPEEYGTFTNSVIIIGSNGSGKSKLGAWIEQNYAQSTHRIGAQRSLEFGTYIKQMSYEQATNKLISGTEKIVKIITNDGNGMEKNGTIHPFF